MTVRLQLPLSMGKTPHIDPYTFEPVIEHPILKVGSSYCGVKSHITDWLAEQYGIRNIGDMIGFADGEYYIDFPTEADMVWFKLKWL